MSTTPWFLAFVVLGGGAQAWGQGRAAERRVTAVVEREISGPMVIGPQPTSDDDPKHSPGGERILYRAEIVETEELVLVSAPSDPDLPATVISDPEGAEIEGYLWSLDGSQALYWTNNELFVAPADGGQPPLRLHPAPGVDPGEDLSSVTPTRDGARVLYQYQSRLHSNALSGGTPIDLSQTSMLTFASAPGGVALFSKANQLYSVPEDGSAPPLLLAAAGGVLDPTGMRGVYRSGNRLWSVPLDMSSPAVPLIPVLPAFAAINDFLVSPTMERVVFRSDALVDGQIDLFTAATDGSSSAALELLLGVEPGGGVNHIFSLTPDGARVLFRATTGAPLASRLFSTEVEGGPAVELFPDSPSSPQISPDSEHVVFLEPLPSFQERLVSIPLAGGAVQALTAVLPIDRIQAFGLSSSDVLYLYQATGSSDQELYRVPIDPGGPPPAPVRLNDPFVAPGHVWHFDLAPDGGSVAFVATVISGLELEVFRSELAGLPETQPYVTPGPIGTLGDVIEFVARAGRVVYVADQDVDRQHEVYVVPANGSGPPVKLNDPFVAGGSVAVTLITTSAALELTPDGSRAVYLADAEVDGQAEVYSVTTDGKTPSVKLNGELAPGTSVGSMQLSPDGARVVYVAHELGRPGFELRSVPVVGGSSTLLAAVSGSILTFQIAPDSSFVVFEDTRLYSVPLTGGTVLDLTGSVSLFVDFAITADSERAVFLYRTASGQPVRLCSRPLAGGPLVVLNSSSPSRFELSEDGSRALFLIAGAAQGQELLYSVPVDLSAFPLLMHAASLDATSFQTHGQHVLIHVESTGFPFVDEWRVLLLDGSATVTVPDATQHSLAPDGETVVLRQGDTLLAMPSAGGSPVATHTHSSLFLHGYSPGGKVIVRHGDGSYHDLPLVGGPARRLIPPGIAFGGQLEFVRPNRWLYLGERDDPDTVELYTGAIERIGPP